MKNTFLFLIAATLGFASCTQEYLPEQTLSNKERMNQLEVKDPLVWNSLVTQYIEIDTTDLGLKGGTDIKARQEYPGSGKYYYAIFEDLYPSQGDYDFNDLMMESRLYVESKSGNIFGNVNSMLMHRGGSLKTRLGLIFYSFDGKNGYVNIPAEQILVNNEKLGEDGIFTMDLPENGVKFDIEFSVLKGSLKVKYLWINWFIIVESGKESREIHSSGFPDSQMKEFKLPQRHYLTDNNLPWGLEVEAEKFYIPAEKASFLDAFPEFQGWAESNGQKNTSWFRNPNFKFIQ